MSDKWEDNEEWEVHARKKSINTPVGKVERGDIVIINHERLMPLQVEFRKGLHGKNKFMPVPGNRWMITELNPKVSCELADKFTDQCVMIKSFLMPLGSHRQYAIAHVNDIVRIHKDDELENRKRQLEKSLIKWNAECENLDRMINKINTQCSYCHRYSMFFSSKGQKGTPCPLKEICGSCINTYASGHKDAVKKLKEVRDYARKVRDFIEKDMERER
jgi:hypothetical protein